MRQLLLRSLLVLSAALGAAASVAAVPATRVVLKPYAEAATREVRLGEVATVLSEDAEVAQRLSELVIAHVGLVAQPTRLLRSELARHVHRNRPFGSTVIEWQGAETVSIQVRTVRVEPQDVVERAAAELQAALASGHSKVELRPVSHVDVLRLPPGDVSIAVKLPSTQGAALQPARRMRVDVELAQQGEPLRRIPLWFEVQAFAPGWIARGDLPTGHPLNADDLEQGLVDRARLGGDAIADATEAIGMRLRRPMRSGDGLRRSLLEPMPAVLRGNTVSVQLKSGPVTVGSSGVALADGSAGQLVPVKLSSAQVLRGRVVGPGLLEVEGAQ